MKREDFGDISNEQLIEQLFAIIDQMVFRITELEACLGMKIIRLQIRPR
jgi:hypothetical protein